MERLLKRNHSWFVIIHPAEPTKEELDAYMRKSDFEVGALLGLTFISGEA